MRQSRISIKDNKESTLYYVYVHTLPNGKIYIGSTNKPYQRWNNGFGYINNQDFYEDILKYGWENIRHEIIMTFQDYEQAFYYEKMLIILCDAENPEVGYNKTTHKKDLLNKYNHKRLYSLQEEKDYENYLCKNGYNPFYIYDIPISKAEIMINEWIYDERDRDVAKERFLNGKKMDVIAKEKGLSARRISTIVSHLTKDIERHI